MGAAQVAGGVGRVSETTRKRIGFGLDKDGFFAVLFNGETPERRMVSEPCCHVAMVQGIAWAEREHIPVEVVRVDTRLLQPTAPSRARRQALGAFQRLMVGTPLDTGDEVPTLFWS